MQKVYPLLSIANIIEDVATGKIGGDISDEIQYFASDNSVGTSSTSVNSADSKQSSKFLSSQC